MSPLRPSLRAAARRAALVSLRVGYRAAGLTRQAMAQPGVTVLLLHYTPAPLLTRLLRFVDGHRDQVVGFQEGMDLLSAGAVDRPLLALTFDDGFRSNLDAARALTDRGIKACFYVPTGIVGAAQDEVDRFFRRPQPEGVMTWEDLEELRRDGHVVGSHCRQHVPLSQLPLSEAEDQVKGSVEELRGRLGMADHFAWPFGSLADAPVDRVVRWCAEMDVLAASGIRGRNTPELMDRRGYLSRDAVDLRWLATDLDVFTARSFAKLAG